MPMTLVCGRRFARCQQYVRAPPASAHAQVGVFSCSRVSSGPYFFWVFVRPKSDNWVFYHLNAFPLRFPIP